MYLSFQNYYSLPYCSLLLTRYLSTGYNFWKSLAACWVETVKLPSWKAGRHWVMRISLWDIIESCSRQEVAGDVSRNQLQSAFQRMEKYVQRLEIGFVEIRKAESILDKGSALTWSTVRPKWEKGSGDTWKVNVIGARVGVGGAKQNRISAGTEVDERRSRADNRTTKTLRSPCLRGLETAVW